MLLYTSLVLSELVGIIINYFQFKNTYKRNFMVMEGNFMMKLVISSFIYFRHDSALCISHSILLSHPTHSRMHTQLED